MPKDDSCQLYLRGIPSIDIKDFSVHMSYKIHYVGHRYGTDPKLHLKISSEMCEDIKKTDITMCYKYRYRLGELWVNMGIHAVRWGKEGDGSAPFRRPSSCRRTYAGD